MPFKRKRKKHHRKLPPFLRLFITLFIVPTLLVCVWIIFLEKPYSGNKPSTDFVAKAKWLSEHSECTLGPGPQIENTSEESVITATPTTAANKDEVTLTLWDQNTWSMLISLTPQQRLINLGYVIKNRHIVTMQELFTSQALQIDEYAAHPYFAFPGQGNTVMKRTGLGILSKFRITKINHHLYTSSTHWDSIANKGVFYTEIDHPQLGLIDVFTTHLQASYGPISYNEVRATQIRELIEFFNRYPNDRLKIVTGDFNFKPDNPLYAQLLQTLNLIDLSSILNPNPSEPFVTYPNSNKQLDYIFIKLPITWDINKAKSQIRAINLDLSDHLSLCAKIVLDKKETSH
ncbi:endonuclease/exonuclease/phosphatase family protein [bacterium]|nr:endonuclease/exonuclease/phosphatase family protein [bacterium]